MQDLEAIALLHDPARRALYEYVVAQGRDVGRNEAAEAVGVHRPLAAFHLDRLARAGLLETAFRRLTERSGPGAGRPAKVYRRATTERAISVPPRDYARAARVFAEAIERTGAETKLYEVAREQGAAAGRALGGGANAPESLERLRRDLDERGYRPYTDEHSDLRLRNCPFDALARDFPVLACGMNFALLEGMLEGAGFDELHVARIDPRVGECCVVLASKTNSD
jgi:predicted ArsR family transcriptional regulator